jgi:hypothetical protein
VSLALAGGETGQPFGRADDRLEDVQVPVAVCLSTDAGKADDRSR